MGLAVSAAATAAMTDSGSCFGLGVWGMEKDDSRADWDVSQMYIGMKSEHGEGE